MDPEISDKNEIPVVKIRKRLSNGKNEQDATEMTSEVRSPAGNMLENGTTCNGTSEDLHNSDSCEGTDVDKDFQNSAASPASLNTENVKDDDSVECVRENFAVDKVSKSFPCENVLLSDKDNNKGDNFHELKTDKNCDRVSEDESSVDDQDDCDKKTAIGALQNTTTVPGSDEENSACDVTRKDTSTQNEDAESICVISCVTSGVHSDINFDSPSESLDASESADIGDQERHGSNQTSDKKNKISISKDKGLTDDDVEIISKHDEVMDKEDLKKLKRNKEAAKGSGDMQHNNEDAEAPDSDSQQNMNKKAKTVGGKKTTKGDNSASQKIVDTSSPKQNVDLKKNEQHNDADAADDIEVIGVTKIANVSTPKNSSQNAAFVPGALPGSSTMSQGPRGLTPTYGTRGMPTFPAGFPGSVSGQMSQNMSLLVPTVAPPKPKSSLDQIELIRWEIQNRINTRPKYFKPNSSSELGPLAKFLFDIGSDLIKECVYHDLVRIQSRKKGNDKLSTKEKEDLEKLKEIEKELCATIGHLKLKLRQKCKVCHFQTESHNVMYSHKQYPHEDNKFLKCAYCSFSTKQTIAFKFHLESEHGVQPKLQDKKAFYECDLCPYENNQEQKLTLHKQRCIKQFRPLFNLHPSCLSGAEINLCLENIFYRPVVPKNLKLLQQKHAQQQAALAEAKRQQVQMQTMAAQKNTMAVQKNTLAAQKNAAAVVAKKQQQSLPKRMPTPTIPNAAIPSSGRMPFSPQVPGRQQPVRYNANSNVKVPCPTPTVATMLNAKQNPATSSPAAAGNTAAGGFEVCEICGGYVKDRKALRIHFFYAHRIDLPFNLFERNQAPLYCATCYVRFWTAHGLRKHIDTHKEENQTRGVVGKCISCGHHVLNLLLHMRVVHNREMQHYINALMCMFCGNHFGNQQECERHILKVHGHIDPVTGTLKSAPNAPPQPQVQKTPPANKKTGNNNLVKGSVCVLCNLNFGRNVDLTRHCMRMHHTCMKCGMVVIDKASLMKHTCLSSPSGTRDCTMCGESGFHPAYYVKHLRDKHLKRFSIRVSKLNKTTIEQWTKRPYPFEEKEILVEISDSEDDVSPVEIKAPPATASAGKRPRMGPACKMGRVSESPKTVDVPKAEADKADDIDKDVTEDAADSEKEVKVTAEDISSPEEENISSESTSGQKRKADAESPESETASKKQKL